MKTVIPIKTKNCSPQTHIISGSHKTTPISKRKRIKKSKKLKHTHTYHKHTLTENKKYSKEKTKQDNENLLLLNTWVTSTKKKRTKPQLQRPTTVYMKSPQILRTTF